MIFLVFLVYTGLYGSRDPLANPLPLFLLTLWWVIFVILQAIFGNLWHWFNPWTGLYQLLWGDKKAWITLPTWVGIWPGVIGILFFGAYALADIAPDDPARDRGDDPQ